MINFLEKVKNMILFVKNLINLNYKNKKNKTYFYLTNK